MRKFIYCLLVAIMFVACAKKQPKQVGDIIEINGVEGVIFDVSEDGQHGKALSVVQAYLDWCGANDWYSSLGENWDIATNEELSVVYAKKSVINAALRENGYQELGSDTYWALMIDSDGLRCQGRFFMDTASFVYGDDYRFIPDNVRIVTKF